MAKATLMEDDSPTFSVAPRLSAFLRPAYTGPLEIPVTPAEEAVSISTFWVIPLINAT